MELCKRHWAAAFGIAVATHLGLAMWTQRSVHQVGRTGAGQPGIELVLNTALRAAPVHESAPERPAPASVPDAARKSPAVSQSVEPSSQRQARPKPTPQPEAATPPPTPAKTAPWTAMTQKPSNRAEPGRASASSDDSVHADMDGEREPLAAGASESSQAYFAELQAYLERHRRYPRGAQLHRQEGTAVLYFVIDRQGNVLDYRIERSSGYRLLDREVAAMLERAKPMPPAPPDLQRTRIELLLPIRFSMR